MTVVVEASGAQVLPNVGDVRVTVTGWAVHCAADGDLRAVSAHWRDLAGRLYIVRGAA